MEIIVNDCSLDSYFSSINYICWMNEGSKCFHDSRVERQIISSSAHFKAVNTLGALAEFPQKRGRCFL